MQRRRHSVEQRAQALVVDRLGEEVRGPALHRLDRELDGAVRGDEDHRPIPARAPDHAQQVEARGVRQNHVGEHGVRIERGDSPLGRAAVGGGRHLEPERLESFAQDLAHGFFVVHDEDLERSGHEPPAVIRRAPGIRRA
jgi:hypothetical protein